MRLLSGLGVRLLDRRRKALVTSLEETSREEYTNMRKVVLVFFAALLFAFLGTSSSNAQTQFGSVRGVVRDPQGAAVPDAKVVLTNTATNVSQETMTNGDGLYVVANVAPGSYQIKISKDGFQTSQGKLAVGVAETVSLNFSLEIGKFTETVTVSESALTINTTSGEISREISARELENLPLLTRNPYNLVALAPGAADTGSVTGDMRGLGLAVGGSRTSSVNFMLDGGENNDTFIAGVGQTVPLDAVQQFKVQSNSTTAEFGRNSTMANVVTKSGTNSLHGSAYDFYRGAGLSTATFDDNANNKPKSNFVRNQFGVSLGGPVKKDKLFFFGSFEGIRTRSSTLQQYFIPTQNFLDVSSPETNAFITGFGGLPSSDCADQAITAGQIVTTIEGAPSYTGNELINFKTGAAVPESTQLFCRTSLRRPFDAGGGNPQNTWLATGRVDYNFSTKTQLFTRYAYQKTDLAPGTVSFSPYAGFTTGSNTKNQNITITLAHSFSSHLFGELRGTYNRVNTLLPLGQAPATTACWQYDLFNQTQSFGGQLIVFPGYVPDVCAFAGIPFGGPQNIYQGHGGMTWLKGKHTVKWGGGYLHMRDNRTFGAYENAYFDTFTMQGMINGGVDFLFAAVDPKGKVPGDTYCITTSPCPTGGTTDGALGFPSFTRHYHYNELAGYVEDSVKVTSRFTLTLGLRWEYYGVHHSPSNEKLLDANLYLDSVGSVPPLTSEKTIFEQVRDARFRRTNQFYRPDYNNFAPRVGLAYDFFGNGRTVFRAGYGIYYDRNFGNAVFNAIQNPPNYAVLSFEPDGAINIQPNQFDSIGQLGGSFVISSSARMLNNDMPTAYSQQWNGTIEHNLFGKGIIASVSYLGYKGDKLYSLNNLNQRGSCLLLVQAVPGSPCNPAGGNSSRINQTGLTGMNRRSNEGFSRYHALAFEVKTQEIAQTGLFLNGTYTWAHSIDNESSFFGDSAFEGFAGFGFRNAYNPGADRSNSSNDIRHRGTISGVWQIPYKKNQAGIAGRILGGWSVSGIYVAQTGGAFPVYDGSTSGQCVNSGTNFCYPVLAGGSLPGRTATDTGSPNSFNLYDLGTSGVFTTQSAFCRDNTLNTPLGTFGGDGTTTSASYRSCTAALINLFPDQLLSGRNLFRTPGIWNIDAAVIKDIHMPWEGHKLQFRAEFFNIVNHSNLYAFPGSNVFSGSGSFVEAKRGIPASFGAGIPKERRNIQLALRYIF